MAYNYEALKDAMLSMPLTENEEIIDLSKFDLIVINSSGGKDSVCAIFEICRLAKEQSFPFDRIHVSHQDLGKVEWEGTFDLVKEQCTFFGLQFHFSKRRNRAGYNENLLEYIERRGFFPSNTQRFCTSDFKRGPGQRVVTKLGNEYQAKNILYVFGFRASESPSRKKKQVFVLNKLLTNSKRKVYDFLPIHDWTTKKVWETIKQNKLPYHYAYKLGMPRLSCVFCIFSPLDALVVAGKENPELLEEYVRVEKKIGHSFRQNLSLESVQQKINEGYIPTKIEDWTM